MTPELDVVVVGYHSEAYLPGMLKALTENSKTRQNVLSHDNTERREPLTHLWNWLAGLGSAPYICWINPDTVPGPGWDVRILDAMRWTPEIGLAGPMTNSGHPGQLYRGSMPSVPDQHWMQNFADQNRGANAIDTDIYGFCMVARRDLWERTGRFDERFRLYGQDSEFAWRVRQLGGRTVCVRSSFVFHHAGKSVAEAKRLKEIEFYEECQHTGTLYQELLRGKQPRWDTLPVPERRRQADLAAEGPRRTWSYVSTETSIRGS